MTERTHSSVTGKTRVTIRMTDSFAQDLNLLMASYGLSDVSYIVRESVSAQADYVRTRVQTRLDAGGQLVQTEENEA